MYCPIHRLPVLYGEGDTCPVCASTGRTVIECELDKIDRTLNTMHAQGYETCHRDSHAVLVFLRKSSTSTLPEAV